MDPMDELLMAALRDEPPAEVQQRLHAQLADFRAKLVHKSQPFGAWLLQSRRSVWLGLGASAAVVAIIANMTLVVLRPQTSFADVVAAIQRLSWVHVSTTEGNDETRELWYSPIDDISASRGKDWVEYYDHKLKVYYSYDVEKNVLYRVPEYMPRRASQFVEIAEALRLVLNGNPPADKPFNNLKFLGPEGSKMELLEQSTKRVEEGGRQWVDYRLKVRHSGTPDPVDLLFRVDPTTSLPHFCRVEGKWQGTQITTEQRIDYPDRGPRSVYELGVPQSAKLVDRVPTNDIVRILDTIRAGRQRMDDYRAIVASRMDAPDYQWWNNDFPMIFYRKGDKTRVDNARWTGGYPYAEKPADGEDMEKWWRNRAKDFLFCPLYITHGPTVYEIKTRGAKNPDGTTRFKAESVEKRDTNQLPSDVIPPYYSRTPEFVCRPPLGIPQQSLEPIIETKPGSGPAGSILLRVARSGRVPGAPGKIPARIQLPDVWRYWLDPKRDYVALRYDMVGENDSGQEQSLASTVIEELKQSPRGIWYATRFRVKAVPPVQHDQIFNVYMDFDATLPDSVFEPPAAGQSFP
jgi:hypothetical protein